MYVTKHPKNTPRLRLKTVKDPRAPEIYIGESSLTIKGTIAP
jgi:hypothetical protein